MSMFKDAVALRAGARRLIPRWEFGHLRALGDSKTYGWATLFLPRRAEPDLGDLGAAGLALRSLS